MTQRSPSQRLDAKGSAGTDATPRAILHGVLVNVAGIGVLITGESGSGKSDCALHLISNGNILVADDVVEIFRVDGRLIGSAPESFAGLLHLRGIGIVDIKELFGASSFSDRVFVDICIDLVDEVSSNCDPTLADIEYLGVAIPEYKLFVSGARNTGLLVETIVRLSKSNRRVTY